MILKSNFIPNVRFQAVDLILNIYNIQINPKMYYNIALDLIQGLKRKHPKSIYGRRKPGPKHEKNGEVRKSI